MSEPISISDIPRVQGTPRWPYATWLAEIPEGMALEVTEQLDGARPKSFVMNIHHWTKRNDLPLRAFRRGGRVWIAHVKEASRD